VETALTYMAWFMDEDLLGLRVADIVRAMDYAQTRSDIDRGNLRVLGHGAAALWTMFAAVLDRRIVNLVCERGLLSYGTLAQVDRYTHGAGIFVRDILLHFDLPEIAASLNDRSLTLASPVDHLKRPVPLDAARRAYAVAESNRFQITSSLDL
jgi:hypothetical protein